MARRWRTRPATSAPAVSTSSANSSRPASVAASVAWGNVTPTSTMRSRTVREMRVSVKAESVGRHGPRPPCRLSAPGRSSGLDGRPPSAPGHRPGQHGPRRRPGPPRVPPGLWTVDRSHQAPAVGRGGGGHAAGAAGLGLPHPPLPHPERDGVGPGPTAMNSTLIPPGWTAWRLGADRGDVHVGRVGPEQHQMGIAHVDRRAVRSANPGAGRARARRAHVHRGRGRSVGRPGRYSTILTPASGPP